MTTAGGIRGQSVDLRGRKGTGEAGHTAGTVCDGALSRANSPQRRPTRVAARTVRCIECRRIDGIRCGGARASGRGARSSRRGRRGGSGRCPASCRGRGPCRCRGVHSTIVFVIVFVIVIEVSIAIPIAMPVFVAGTSNLILHPGVAAIRRGCGRTSISPARDPYRRRSNQHYSQRKISSLTQIGFTS
jgi:hypothetical protein